MRVLREPLFHFFLLGLAIFGYFFWLNPQDLGAPSDDQIIVDAQDAERLSAQFEATWRRRPTEAELQGLLDGLVTEEVLVREAQALGLDQGDGVVRNRLAQKMTFLTTSVAQSLEPTDADLMAYMEENPTRFVLPQTAAFEQLLLPPDADPAQLLKRLEDGGDPADLAGPTLLPPSLPKSAAVAIDSTFGNGFFAQLAQQPNGQWAGPVTSGYGQHLVRVTEFEESVLPPFESIRDDVLLEWRREQSDNLTEAQIDLLKARYEISTPTGEDLKGWTSR